jgi:multiple antibiotic resistance protein
MQIRFLSFQIFGGIIFMVIGIRLLLGIGSPVSHFRTDMNEASGTIAVPFIVGPGTVGASVLTGSRLDLGLAQAAIALALTTAMLTILAFKWLHNLVQRRSERYIERHTEIAGRATALFTGSFAIEMILSGFERWIARLSTCASQAETARPTVLWKGDYSSNRCSGSRMERRKSDEITQ